MVDLDHNNTVSCTQYLVSPAVVRLCGTYSGTCTAAQYYLTTGSPSEVIYLAGFGIFYHTHYQLPVLRIGLGLNVFVNV